MTLLVEMVGIGYRNNPNYSSAIQKKGNYVGINATTHADTHSTMACMRRPTDTEHRQPVAAASFAHAQGQLSTDAAARSRSQWKVTWRLMSPPSWLASSTARSCLTCRFDLCPSAPGISMCINPPPPPPPASFQRPAAPAWEVRSATHARALARAALLARIAWPPYGSPPAGVRALGSRGRAGLAGGGTGMWGAAGEPARGAPPGAGHVGQAEYTFPCSGPRNLCSEAGTIRPPTPAAPAIVPAGRVCD